MTHDDLCLHNDKTQKLIHPLSCVYCNLIAKARTAGYKAGHNDGWQDAQETWENS